MNGDRIELRGVTGTGYHGVLASERAAGQRFSVDADLQLDTAPAAASDQLAASVDYAELAADLQAVITGEPVNLLETLADRLIRVCLARPRVLAATVRVHKPQAPIAVPFEDVRVRVHRQVAVLSLGSNLGDRYEHLQAAVALLAERLVLLGCSPVYETDPVGGPPGQGSYLNAVVRVGVADPWAALAAGQRAERTCGRQRGARFGPRTLDVDVVSAAGRVSGDPRLTLPHPRAGERAFVLAPWLDLDPLAVLPGVGPVAELLAAVGTVGVRLRPDLVLA